MKGVIYKASDEIIDEIVERQLWNEPFKEVAALIPKMEAKTTIEGQWAKYLKVGGKKIWWQNMVDPA